MSYRQDLKKTIGKGASQMLDTPDLRRVKKTQQTFSNVSIAITSAFFS